MERIGRYVAERTLGSGAFGTVWLARDEAIDSQVAIKVLAENWAQNDAVRQRFIDEARILFQAESDHIVRVHTVDELPDGRPYFVMEYADRGSLEERMAERARAKQQFSVEEALATSRDIARGLKVAHAFGIAHRDLKPANVMFRSVPAHLGGGESDERLVLVDFGVAKSLASGSTTIATGTPHYMAPEQAEGRADNRSDLYSAAVILYELLAGRVPYPVDSIGALIRAQSAADFPSITSLRDDVSPELDAAIRRGLSMDPNERSQSADEWLATLSGEPDPTVPIAPVPVFDPTATLGPEQLEQLRATGQIPAVGGTPPPIMPPPAPPGGGAPTPPPSKPQRKKGPLVYATLGVIALVAAVVGGALALGGGDEADGAAEVFLEPISSVGTNPFGDVAPDTSTTPVGDAGGGGSLFDVLANLQLPDFDLPEPGGGGDNAVPVIEGAAPGLYGGTNLLSVCDTKKLVQFLEDNAEKASAWAATLGIRVDEIATYVASLTDVVLQVDTRVINHGFREGVANAIDSILQKGTAVLVDLFGVPVVRCKCGNPLLPARPLADDVAVKGSPWPDFDLDATVTITKGPEVQEFVLTDVVTKKPVYRVPGAPASSTTNTPTVKNTTTTTRATTTTTEQTTTTAGGGEPLSDLGITSASSTFSGQYGTGNAVDGDESSSWFSAGGGSADFTWLAPAIDTITKIEIVGNGQHPEFPTGFGFESVDIVVLNSDGDEVFRETRSLAGTPDPTVSVSPGVGGNQVVLYFSGGESPDCGGFSELNVYGTG